VKLSLQEKQFSTGRELGPVTSALAAWLTGTGELIVEVNQFDECFLS